MSDFEEEDDEEESMGTQLLPTHVHNNLGLPLNNKGRLADVWDERDDVFDVGAESDDEHDIPTTVSQSQLSHPGHPRIVVSHA